MLALPVVANPFGDFLEDVGREVGQELFKELGNEEKKVDQAQGELITAWASPKL